MSSAVLEKFKFYRGVHSIQRKPGNHETEEEEVWKKKCNKSHNNKSHSGPLDPFQLSFFNSDKLI